MTDCVFCKIIKGDIPSKKFYEDDEFIIIADINPQADKHYLLIPKRHYADITQMTDEDAAVLARALKKLSSLADELGLSNGFRIINNKGADSCQSVFHLHIHILGGNKLSERMG
ncbi:MAG: histidine triad nucleotide-binding protein [Clostridiales bacterium]|mgnify:FL=1|jgi:histidine triad (HIT) family protein|nr:histidine triad nucleotide-binding protein [Clostridiales bacterium]HOK81311.1 histidine triad nucleotide-binding protein [Clostridia bacterium]HOL60430.1 histidine triad nucleotide-binding protein [Clostridia bacterium]HPO53187.1 histidine triad nucleotide-binding protein [Clostridia bacterium]